MAQVYIHVIFRNKIRHSDDFGLRKAVVQENPPGNVLPLIYRRTRRNEVTLFSFHDDLFLYECMYV